MKKRLRFAALIRVSTEKQADKGESLRKQKADIIATVKSLGGVIVGWYGGQEHATPGHEKKEVRRLLADAAQSPRPFDFVMVHHADRWSRDNVASATGLDHLLENGVRYFYVLTDRHDLIDPNDRLRLGFHAMIGEYLAKTQSKKSIEARIHRAKRGVPTGGKLPFGRKFDVKTAKWSIDKEKKKLVEDAARRYLDGESLGEVAAEYGINHANLHKTLMQRCGTEWQIEFNYPKLDIHEVVTLQVPPLLSDKVIKALHQKAKNNKTFSHGETKHKYLLGRMIFCSHCGYAMMGQVNRQGHTYYRHAARTECTKEGIKAWVRGEQIDVVVMKHLFECFGNPAACQRAIEEATPNLTKVTALMERRERLLESLSKCKAGRQKIVRLIANDMLSDEDAEAQLKESSAKEAELVEKLSALNQRIGNMPTPDSVRAFTESVANGFRSGKTRSISSRRLANHDFDGMSYEDKRALAERVFGGTTEDGKRMGVYIEWVEGQEERRKKIWKYTIRGHLIHRVGHVPMSESRQDAFFSFGAGQLDDDAVTGDGSY